jgi:hypothetical protein
MLYREIIAVCSETHTNTAVWAERGDLWMLHLEVNTATWLLGLIQTNWRLRTFRITYFYFVMSSIHYYNYRREFIGLPAEEPIPRIQTEQSFLVER